MNRCIKDECSEFELDGLYELYRRYYFVISAGKDKTSVGEPIDPLSFIHGKVFNNKIPRNYVERYIDQLRPLVKQKCNTPVKPSRCAINFTKNEYGITDFFNSAENAKIDKIIIANAWEKTDLILACSLSDHNNKPSDIAVINNPDGYKVYRGINTDEYMIVDGKGSVEIVKMFCTRKIL